MNPDILYSVGVAGATTGGATTTGSVRPLLVFTSVTSSNTTPSLGDSDDATAAVTIVTVADVSPSADPFEKDNALLHRSSIVGFFGFANLSEYFSSWSRNPMFGQTTWRMF